MKRRHSPSSLMRFYVSPYEAWMYKYLQEVDPNAAQEDPEDTFMQVVSKKGDLHERQLYEDLKTKVGSPIIISGVDPEDMIDATKRAMEEGRDLIYQGALGDQDFFGRADFLFKVNGKSKFGNYAFEIWDAKLANKSKPEYLLQLCCYSDLLESMQESLTPNCVLVYGNSEKERFNIEEYFVFYKAIKKQYLEFHKSFNPEELPNPENYTDWGRFTDHAKKTLEGVDHLSQIAGIRKSQITKLNEVGISTMQQLAERHTIEGSTIKEKNLRRLQSQASMQSKTKRLGKMSYEVLRNIEPSLGLYSLPPKSDKDIYFDIESNILLTKIPLHYLWGVAHEDNEEGFNCWWAHSETEMKKAFEDFVDWTFSRWISDKDMHVFHYGQFEITALRTLMGHFGTKEEQVDQLLRNEVFVDLLRVVRQSLCIGSTGYGLKAIEPLFRGDRVGEVSGGQDSIVVYESWSADRGDTKDHTDSDLLKDIWDYNKDDCVSLIHLANFLRDIQRENDISYSSQLSSEREVKKTEVSDRIEELVRNLEQKEKKPHAKILANLCLYHRRESKPVFWRMFDRFEATDQDLVDDLDCLGDLVATGEVFELTSRSNGYEFTYDPNQDSKLKIGDSVRVKQDPSLNATIEELNLEKGLILLKSTSELPRHLSLIPYKFISARPIEESIQQTASEYLKGKKLNPCIDNFLLRNRPNFKNDYGEDLSTWGKNTLDSAIKVATELDGGYFCIQGPPGAGKTFVGSRVISALVESGARIGISSNSHKAINNLIEKVISVMDEDEIKGQIARIDRNNDEPLYENKRIEQFPSIAQANLSENIKVIAGTAWAFANEVMWDGLDYLFIDEAGQVSLANLVGMSRSTKNIILMGDQMQLGQPTQGIHPGETGASSLDYLLGNLPTIPKDIGMLLPETYRLHPDICKFISTRVYGGKLEHVSLTEKRKLILGSHSSITKSSGIMYVPVEHFGNEQASEEEILIIKELIKDLMLAKKTDTKGAKSPVAAEDLLVVAPYNHQVRNLQDGLGRKFNVGTVDKFQGREALVVIISMTASDIESAPRGAEFLLEKNRLNVAISRAQCLAIVVTSSSLILPVARSVKEMSLVNFYMDLINYAC